MWKFLSDLLEKFKPYRMFRTNRDCDSTMTRQFAYSKQDFVTDVHKNSGMASMLSNFDATIQASWKERMDKGLFRYRLGDLQTRIIPGSHGFVAELNIERATEKRKPQEILSIQQEFNIKQFNFNKINPEEVIIEMIKDTEGGSEEGRSRCKKMAVLVNVSPLGFGHCLFVPDPLLCFPQVLTRFAIRASIESVLLSSDPGFRMGFNSLGAFASVNHLHLHGYYLNCELKIESKPAKPLIPQKGFYRFLDFPGGFLFYTEAEGVEEIARAICEVTDMFVDKNVAHNLFLTRGCPPCSHTQNEEARQSRRGVRIAVWPRPLCFGPDEEPAFSIAFCELAGHLPFKNEKDYELATEKGVIDIMQKYLLPDEEVHALEQQLTQHLMRL